MVAASSCCVLQAQSNHAGSLSVAGIWRLHSRIPLGADALLLEPSHQTVEMLASAEAPQFEGWRLDAAHGKPALLNTSGKPVRALPERIAFRVTAGTLDRLSDLDPLPLRCSESLNDFLLGLRFEVEVFRGMQMRVVRPENVKIIGVPADETSQERIYRVQFDLGTLLPEDRIALIVSDRHGVRLTKFHLEFL
ncbi:MAG TPA: hypothetical protein VFQ00_02125 [Terriglobales bacterium]|nr:hypothetical protein [Terriglobales bacterium]